MDKANKKIVEYIRDNWVVPTNNNSLFATEHNLDEKTVRRIKDDSDYKISLITIMRICEARNLKLAEFFKLMDL
ncbi:hypothetical protein ACFS5J_04975 [Flavobacterium chuncheonense]|jgi:hypothetical protein|uniref:Transcriptional regulator n=1 Tax=Flavobacterium chuncheonense TaxID=2026653 RepID=A0ABW5YK17_9FLAO